MLSFDVVIIDDHPVIGMAISKVLAKHSGVQDIQYFSDPQKALPFLKSRTTLTIVILDLQMPNLSGLNFLQILLKENPAFCNVLVYTAYDDLEHEVLAIRAGAKGYLAKSGDLDNLLKAFDAIASKRTYFRNEALSIALSSSAANPAQAMIESLGKRELEIATRLAAGQSNAQIGKALFISPKTVSTHKTNIFEKLNIDNVPALIEILKSAQSS